jgi:transcriptional regulator with XRE-family HTH domain
MFLRQLRLARKQNKLSQLDVADILGVSRSTYIAYEKGERTIDAEGLVKLSQYYKLPIERFFEDVIRQYAEDEEYFANQPDTRFLSQLSKEEHQHLVNLRKLSEADRAKIVKETEEKVVSKN